MSSATAARVAGWRERAARDVGWQGDSRPSSSSSSVDSEEVLPADSGEVLPNEVERRCTDTRWVVVFLLANAVLVCVLYVANRSGSVSRLIALHDFQHNRCGTGEKVNEPYIFFCKNASGELELGLPICSVDCPSGSHTQHSCWNEAAGAWHSVRDYATRVVSGVACGALNTTLATKQMGWVGRNTSWLGRVVFVLHAWQPLSICLLIAVVASTLYIGLLGEFAKQLAYFGLLVLSVAPFSWGLVLLRWWYNGTYAPGLVYGTLLVSTGASFFCILCCASHDMDKISSLIRLSCKCVMRIPPMRTGPILNLVVKYGYFVLVIRGILQLYAATQMRGHSDSLIVPQPAVLAAIAFCAFMLLWTNNLLDAFSDFCLAYLTEVWYFHGGVHSNWRPQCMEAHKVAWIALRYHSGTLILGALVVGFVRPLRLVFGAISALGKSGTQHPLGCLLGSCCCCLVDLYESHLELLSKNAYMEVALSGSDFHSAARAALEVTRTDSGLYSVLNGATWFFQLAGVGLIMLLGNIAAYLLISSCRLRAWRGHPGCSAMWWSDEELGLYVSLCTWGTGLTVLPFVLVFDTVSDAILYCHLVAKWRLARQPDTTSVLTEAASYIWGVLAMGLGWLGGSFSQEVEAQPDHSSNRTRGVAFEEAHPGTASSDESLLPHEAPPLCAAPTATPLPSRLVLTPVSQPSLVVQRALPPRPPLPTAGVQQSGSLAPSRFVIPIVQPVQQTVLHITSTNTPGSLSPPSLLCVRQSKENVTVFRR